MTIGRDYGLQSSLDEALASLSTSHQLRTVQLDKERRRDYNMGGVCIEQTDFTVHNSQSGPQASSEGEGRLPSATKWRSIAIVGAREDVMKFLSEVKVRLPGTADPKTSLGELLRSVSGEPKGYPQFVNELPTS